MRPCRGGRIIAHSNGCCVKGQEHGISRWQRSRLCGVLTSTAHELGRLGELIDGQKRRAEPRAAAVAIEV